MPKDWPLWGADLFVASDWVTFPVAVSAPVGLVVARGAAHRPRHLEHPRANVARLIGVQRVNQEVAAGLPDCAPMTTVPRRRPPRDRPDSD